MTSYSSILWVADKAFESNIMEQNDFEIALNNYRDGVQKTIPAYLTGKMADEEAWVDELALLLHSRDELEWAFAVSPSP